ncbi:MAG: preprotein translocase subunit SecE [Candidatus Kerfeldbacteria bacterium]|nr:preprotein translocase subunit SecE [Candidatus Kerfeldbacteria bacterium]
MANLIAEYFKGSLQEFKKVVWLSKKQTTQHTLLVIGVSLGVALFLGAIDYLLNLGIEKLLYR